jgi:hypothetical protein
LAIPLKKDDILNILINNIVSKIIAFCTNKSHFPFSTPTSSDMMEIFVSVFWYGDEEMGDPLQLLPRDIGTPMWLCIALNSWFSK